MLVKFEEDWRQNLFGLTYTTWSSFNGKGFWVTGAGTGYGRSMACALAAAGAHVVLSGRRKEKLEETLESMTALGISTEHCHVVPMDLCAPESIAEGCKRVAKVCPQLVGIINNAAVPSSPSQTPLLSDSFEHWARVMDTNVTGAWYLTKNMFPAMAGNGLVRVLNISSQAGWSSTPGHGIYNISKAALNSFSHSLAQEGAFAYPDTDIQINTLVAAEAGTEMNKGSDVSPYSIVPSALTLLAQPAGGPNGFFFDMLGWSQPFGDTPAYDSMLRELPPILMEERERARIEDVVYLDKVFAYDNSPQEITLIALLAHAIGTSGQQVALYGTGRLFRYLMKHGRDKLTNVTCIIDNNPRRIGKELYGLPVVSAENIPPSIGRCFLCSTKTLTMQRMRRQLRETGLNIKVLTAEILSKAASSLIPEHAKGRQLPTIYPVDLPEFEFEENLDFILLELPPRYMPMMPFGVAHVHNMLRDRDIKMQTMDTNIIFYHRYQMRKFCDGQEKDAWFTSSGTTNDPWENYNVHQWLNEETLEFFKEDFDELCAKVIAAKPKLLGISLNGNNSLLAYEMIRRVKKALPEILVLGGGFDCVNMPLAKKQLEQGFDYITVGEGEMTVPDVYEALARGERPHDIPGILSKFDSPLWTPQHGPIPTDLDAIGFPTYEFSDITLYKTFKGGTHTPIATTRGCVWGRCHFCAERFNYRKRDPKLVVDEVQWHVERGYRNFHTNESDMNGKPEYLLAIAEEIIRRGLDVSFSGQMRINRKLDFNFFKTISRAGFIHFNFGVDGWTDHTLYLQRKGYKFETVRQNLKDCYNAGCRAVVNAVIGVPGETDDDVEESIQNIISCKEYIHQVSTINQLRLVYNSHYYNDPEKFNIKFRTDKDELYKQELMMVPDTLWYSEEPYIDEKIREQRYYHIVNKLIEGGVRIGDYAKIVNKID